MRVGECWKWVSQCGYGTRLPQSSALPGPRPTLSHDERRGRQSCAKQVGVFGVCAKPWRMMPQYAVWRRLRDGWRSPFSAVQTDALSRHEYEMIFREYINLYGLLYCIDAFFYDQLWVALITKITGEAVLSVASYEAPSLVTIIEANKDENLKRKDFAIIICQGVLGNEMTFKTCYLYWVCSRTIKLLSWTSQL